MGHHLGELADPVAQDGELRAGVAEGVEAVPVIGVQVISPKPAWFATSPVAWSLQAGARLLGTQPRPGKLGARRYTALLAERITGPLGMRETTTDITKFFDSTRFTHCFYCALPRPTPSITDARPGADVAMPHILRNDSVTVVPWQSYDNAVSAGSVSPASEAAMPL